MKNILLTIVINLSFFSFNTFAFTTQDFESVSGGATSFTNDGQTFLISSTVDTYNNFNPPFMDGSSNDQCLPDPPGTCGWNGSAADIRFMDNSGDGGDNMAGIGDGSNFTIATNDSSNFFVEHLYLFCSTSDIGVHTGSVTIEGERNGMLIFTISLATADCNGPSDFGTNNGFSHIDFASAGASNFTDDPIDTLTFVSTGNLDYMALDAFRSESTLLPVTLQSFSID